MASRSSSIRAAASACLVMDALRIASPGRSLQREAVLAGALLAPRLCDERDDAIMVLTLRNEGEKTLPGLDRARIIVLDLEEHFSAVEVDRRIAGIDGDHLVERLERRVGMAADRHDQAQVGHGVDVLRIALEHRLVGGDGFGVVPLVEALPSRAQHPVQNLW